MSLYIFGLLTWSDNDPLGDCMHHGSSSSIFSKMGPCYHQQYFCHIHYYCCCCSTESEYEPLSFVFVAFAVPVEAKFGWNGWLHPPFELNYSQYYRLLVAICWKSPIPLVPQDALTESRHLPLFFQKHLSITDEKCGNAVLMQPKFCRLYLFN